MSVVMVYYPGRNFKLVTNINFGRDYVYNKKDINNRWMVGGENLYKNNGSWNRKIENNQLGYPAQI